ncbi:hypothetical protein [Kitasatospora viridis]|uniref:Uncharacterized protein n=1 Tax=Kitasatospora viridis TaxID=281105 RepID=A0A561ULC7_9ACTN|nr:hypothetical protein [Kitasatospora viridis]TWG00147.1 hypothetical protein FHX73_114016 [Kitasatospora viridis]
MDQARPGDRLAPVDETELGIDAVNTPSRPIAPTELTEPTAPEQTEA